jgi:hypothetical protein
MDATPDGLMERLAEYRLLAVQVRSLQEGVDRISATACSPDGPITAVVGGRGQLLDLTLDPRIYRDQDATALAEAIGQHQGRGCAGGAGGHAPHRAARGPERHAPGPGFRTGSAHRQWRAQTGGTDVGKVVLDGGDGDGHQCDRSRAAR